MRTARGEGGANVEKEELEALVLRVSPAYRPEAVAAYVSDCAFMCEVMKVWGKMFAFPE